MLLHIFDNSDDIYKDDLMQSIVEEDRIVTCPYKAGDLVTWNDDAPDTFHFIFTPGPMSVISAEWRDGKPNEYAKQFSGGFDFKPGWIIVVEYDADSTTYYDPPLSILLGQKRIVKELHEMWLRPA